MPNIAHLVKDGKGYSKARQLIERTLRLQLMIVLLLAAIIAGTRYELVHLLYSAEYAPASQALGILAFGIASLTIFTMLANVLNGSGRPVPPMVVGALGLVVTIIMCSLLIPGHGMIGAAWATAVGSTLALVAVWALVFRQFSVRIRFLTVCRLGLAAAVAYWLAVMVAQSLWLLPLAGILALIGYGATLLLTAEVRTDEVKGLISRL
jgi:O-antigen/teichoic acid export membrane protein